MDDDEKPADDEEETLINSNNPVEAVTTPPQTVEPALAILLAGLPARLMWSMAKLVKTCLTWLTLLTVSVIVSAPLTAVIFVCGHHSLCLSWLSLLCAKQWHWQ